MKKLNNKGIADGVITGGAVLIGIMTVMGVLGGTPKKDASVIACKMSGKGTEVCNAKYDYVDRVDESRVSMNWR